MSNFLETELLDAVANAGAYSAAEVWVKLHTGAPGDDGTANAATETTRQQASFAAASGDSVATDAPLTWTNVSTTEVITHVSLWDASTSGNALWSGALVASKSVTAGDTLTIASGALTLTLTIA